MKKPITGLLSCFALVLLMVPMAFAQTPDGQTPAEETVCDGLDDSLFGTCNAYCEAMDCDSPNHNASAKACQVKLKKWATLAGSEPIPCEQAPGLTLSKTVNAYEENDFMIPIGDEVIYSFTIMNTGNVSLTGIQFDDAILGFSEGDCPEFDPSHTLATNASITCTSNPIPAEADKHTNTALASAETIYGLPVYADPASAIYTGAEAEEPPCTSRQQCAQRFPLYDTFPIYSPIFLHWLRFGQCIIETGECILVDTACTLDRQQECEAQGDLPCEPFSDQCEI